MQSDSLIDTQQKAYRQWAQAGIQEILFKHQKKFITVKVIRCCNRLPWEDAQSPSLAIFGTQ